MSSCSYSSKIGRSLSSSSELKYTLQVIREQLATSPESHQQCTQAAEEAYQKLFKLNSEKTNLLELTAGEIVEMVQITFESKILIRNYLSQLDRQQEYGQKCYHATRSLLRAIRYAEDYMIEHYAVFEKGYERKTDVNKFTTLIGEGIHFKVNPDFEFKNYHDLQSGDVILSRGNAFTSAAIARIGIDDAQFSHVSFVYRDSKNKLWTIEAHIEIGSVVEPIETHIGQGNSRTVVFRFEDRELAHRAAEYVFNHVQKASASGKNIPYDFSMNYKDSKELFCSEVVSMAMRDVGGLDVPKHKSKFNPNLLTFLKQFGIKVDAKSVLNFDTFSPGDLELDPRFSVVAEWRNPLKVRASRQRDAIMTKMFEWMEKDRYVFKPGSGLSLQANMGWLMRRIPLVKRGLINKFPTNMKASQLKLFLVLEKVAEVLEQELLKYDNSPDRPRSFAELYNHLEEFKKQDYIKFRKKKKSSAFHRHFSPK